MLKGNRFRMRPTSKRHKSHPPTGRGEQKANLGPCSVEPDIGKQHELSKYRSANEIEQGHHARDRSQNRVTENESQAFDNVVPYGFPLLALM